MNEIQHKTLVLCQNYYNISTNFVFFIYESGCYNFTSWQVLEPGSTSGSILMQGPRQPWIKQSMLQVMKYQ